MRRMRNRLYDEMESKTFKPFQPDVTSLVDFIKHTIESMSNEQGSDINATT